MIKKIKIFGIILVIIAIFIPIFSFTKYKVKEKIHVIKVDNKLVNNKDYYAILEIPKINLKRELYQIDDKNNDVDKNIFVHESSIFPNEDNSNVILAGHSGSGSNAYFKYLYKLAIGDIINLYFNGNLYEYKIEEIEYQDKTGELYLKQDFDNMITLITCTYKNNKTQTIYYGKLINVENLA